MGAGILSRKKPLFSPLCTRAESSLILSPVGDSSGELRPSILLRRREVELRKIIILFDDAEDGVRDNQTPKKKKGRAEEGEQEEGEQEDIHVEGEGNLMILVSILE